jgi:flagellar hook assembly protein FlgD
MLKTRYLGLKKLTAAVIAVLCIVPQAMALEVGSVPVISNHYANPNPYDPTSDANYGVVTIHYTLNTDAVVTVEILDGGIIRDLGTSIKQPGANFVNWDGKQNHVNVDEGTYNYQITATNRWGTDVATGAITVHYATPQGTVPVVSNDSASPNPFDPYTQSTTITYTLNTTANVTVSILDGATVVETLANPGASKSAGVNTATWDGRDSSNNPFAEKNYTYSIYATNNSGNDTETGSVTVDYVGQSGTAPVISNDYVSPNPFDPNDQTTTIYYTLNTSASVTVSVTNGTYTRTLTSSASQSAGQNTVSWDGYLNGTMASEGSYTYNIYATNSYGNDTETGSVTVDYDNGGSCTTPAITSHYANPNPFDPDEDNARITFHLNATADVTVTIRHNGSIIRTLVDDDSTSSGTHDVYWNGEDEDGDQVDNDTYSYYIYATNNCGSDTEQSTLEVDDDDGNDNDNNDDDFEDDYGDLISDVRVEDALFNPDDNERAKLLFDVEEDNVEVDVRIIDEDEDTVRTFFTNKEYDESNDNSIYWNGRDMDNDIVNDDLYLFKITAEKDNETEVAYEWLEVDTDGHIIGFPDDNNGDCGGFTDVDQDNPYCKAVELMKIKGIFEGYADGSFRPYNPINRAETTKVVLLAIGYSIMSNDGTNLGFWDVVKNAWYMPYLRTAKSRGIINGYPNGAFRPENVPNKVELLKIFLEGANINIPYCNNAPFNDTPVNAQTRWYIDYVCFAANNNLIYADMGGNFNPGAPMNRGDVALLFYNYYVRGLDNGGYNNYNNYNYNNGYNYYY